MGITGNRNREAMRALENVCWRKPVGSCRTVGNINIGESERGARWFNLDWR